MIPTRGTAVLITQGGQQLSLFFAIDLRAVQNLLNLGQLTIQELVEQRHSVRIIGHLWVRRQRAARCLNVAHDPTDFRPGRIIGGEDLFQQVRQLVIRLIHRPARLLVGRSGLIDALL
nr:hypothetical protein [Mycobacterium sp. 20KCMC460]